MVGLFWRISDLCSECEGKLQYFVLIFDVAE